MAPECAACGATVQKRTTKCNSCGNHPRKTGAGACLAIFAAFALGSLFWPPLLFLAVLGLVGAPLAWLLGGFLYPARKYSFG